MATTELTTADARRPGVDDVAVVAYWEAVHDERRRVAVAVAGDRHASSALIVATIERLTADGSKARLAHQAAARNPNTPKGLVFRWATGADGPRVETHAMTNPVIGEDAQFLWDISGAEGVALLANPGVPAEFLERHWRADPALAAQNPHLHPELLAELAAGPEPVAFRAAANPNLPRPALLEALSSPLHSVRRAAVQNPAATVDDIAAVIAADRAAAVNNPARVLPEAENRLDELRWDADPRSTPTNELRYRPIVEPLAKVLGGGGTASDTSRVLLSDPEGFGGTVAELLEVAATFTA